MFHVSQQQRYWIQFLLPTLLHRTQRILPKICEFQILFSVFFFVKMIYDYFICIGVQSFPWLFFSNIFALVGKQQKLKTF